MALHPAQCDAKNSALALDHFAQALVLPCMPGAGLGLTIVQRIIDSAQGQFVLPPAPEGGLLVEIQLPVQQLDAID